MTKNFIDELRWRGMVHDIMPGTEEQLNKELTAGYIGFDPTADSLHIGNLVQIMTLVHFQRFGHKPFALVGGATGMVGDPSGKSAERNLLSEDILKHNQHCVRLQLEKFLDFNAGANSAEMVNNYDWFKEFRFLDFIRDVGKHISVNYMMSKDSVQKRLESGLSFTEFSYQLVQGYDFYWLYKNKNASAEQMHRKIRSIADAVWKKYYARVLGTDGCGLLAVYSHILWCSFYLADYFIGYVIAYQVRKHLRGKNLASEMERMCRVGSIYPNDWMRNAVRSDVSLDPLLVDLESALSRLSRTR